MPTLSALRLGPRLALGFALIVLLCAASVAFGIDRIATMRVLTTRLATVDAEKLSMSERWMRAIESNTARSWIFFFATDPTIKARMKDELQAVIAAQSERVKRMGELAETDADRHALDAISAQREAYQALRNGLIKRHEAGEDITAELFAKLYPAANGYMATVQKLVEQQRDVMQQTRLKADTAASDGSLALAVGGGLAVLLAAVLAWRLTASIVRPIAQAKALALSIAAGDLTQDVSAQGRDEAAELLVALQGMQQALRTMVGQVRGSSGSIQTASAEIAAGNLDLSTRTEQTASQLQQTASSMEQLSGTVRQSAEAARQANDLASSAAEVAERGGSVVAEVVTTMGEINASSKRIADIIGVIDGIAFQTNILALNAAVEAARAGEQGRGFAVVATEVRNLAQRSAAAAREIKSLIGISVDKVESGSRLVADAGQTMNEIVASVKKVSNMIGEVTAAAAEQAAGINDVSSAVGQLDQVTQQNAALVEESAAAAGSLRQQANQLVDAVSAFRLERA